MKTLRIGGVPEHFNFPWKWSLHKGKFSKSKINLTWTDYPKGTGDMIVDLREKKLDMAVILTEGIVRDMVNGNNCKIVQTYVKSPLIWGIHVAKNSRFYSIEDIKGSVAGISRYGSGSHLMTYVHAENQNWNPETDLHFKIVDDLQGAVEALPSGEADYFLWEKFMTKPFVDNGTFRLLGEIPTPWPSFVIVARDEILENDEELVQSVLEIINSTTNSFKEIPKIDEYIALEFDHKSKDVTRWLAITEWSQNQLSNNQLNNIQNLLQSLKLISKALPPHEVLHVF